MSFRRGGNQGQNSFLKNLPFGLGYNDISSVSNSNEYPTLPLPVNNPVTQREINISVNYINNTDSIKEGPFFTGSSLNNVESNEEQHGNLNDGIERYSDKYLKKRKIGVSIDDHPYHLPLFPQELYSVMGINKKKLLKLNKFKSINSSLFDQKTVDDKDALLKFEELKGMAEDLDEDEETKKTGEAEEEIMDDDYNDDEDDDDYNAEKYFSGGDDDGYGDEDDYGDEPAF